MYDEWTMPAYIKALETNHGLARDEGKEVNNIMFAYNHRGFS